jgi:hypothetical protein
VDRLRQVADQLPPTANSGSRPGVRKYRFFAALGDCSVDKTFDDGLKLADTRFGQTHDEKRVI